MQESPVSPAAQEPHALPRHRRSVPLYIGAGGIATGTHYVVTIAAVEALAVPPLHATAVGFATGAVVKYWLNYSVTFRSRARHAPAVARFVVAMAALLALNTLCFALFHRGLGLHYMVAQVATTALLIPPGYVVFRLWVFR